MDTNSTEITNESGLGSYALSGKVMLCSVIILFLVVIIVISFHFYARWLVQRTRRRRLRHHQLPLSRRTANNDYHLSIFPQGLDPSVLKSLPTFVYKPETHPTAMDCAVCLSDFEENETGRTLPKCGHSFHFDCIDMWFQSHSNCPLCRAPVRAAECSFATVQNPSEVVVSVTEIESRSGSDPDCNRNDGSVSSPPGGFMPEERPRKSLDFVVRLPPAEADDRERHGVGIVANGDGGSDSRIPSDKSLTSL